VLHDKALAAASKNDWNAALNLTESAIRQQPLEARFYVTKGRLLEQLKQDSSAVLTTFSKAIAQEPGFYAPYLYRGLYQNILNNYPKAKLDLETSYNILQTQTAAFYLGEIAEKTNQKEKAIAYYRQAAEGGGALGKEASGRLQQLGFR
jgi:beta-barrel assembly-enhancing protease